MKTQSQALQILRLKVFKDVHFPNLPIKEKMYIFSNSMGPKTIRYFLNVYFVEVLVLRYFAF